MSLYSLQKFLYELNRDESIQRQYKEDIESLLSKYTLTDEESNALRTGDIGLYLLSSVHCFPHQ